MLRKSPGFTITAILTLAVGIGVNVAAFGFFNLMLFKPLPVRDPGSLVRFERLSPQGYATYVPYPEMDFLRQYSKTLSAVLASTGGRFRVEGEEKPLSARFVTANFFSELGATPRLGRLIHPGVEDSPGSEPIAVLSHAFWLRHFGGDLSVIGKTLRLGGKPATIIGVAQSDFSGLDLSKIDVWLPLKQQPYFISGSRLLTDFSDSDGVDLWGRLRPGVTRQRWHENEPTRAAGSVVQPTPEGIVEKRNAPLPTCERRADHSRTKPRGSSTPPGPWWHEVLPIVALVSAFVLLILGVSCGNLGSLLLARSVAREREISIRISVGTLDGGV